MKLFISNSRLALFIMLSLTILGVKGLLTLKRESIPPVDFATAVINTSYPGSSSAEVEELITDRIEDEIRTVNGIKDVNSLSVSGGRSQIFVRIDIDSIDSDKVVTDLHQSLQKVRGLPPEVLNPPLLTHLKAETRNPIYYLMVSGPDNNRKRDEIAFNLKSQLEKIPGVYEAKLGSYKEREFQVLLSPDQMKKRHISLADVVTAVKKRSFDIPAGYLEKKKTKHLVRILGKPRTTKDLENIVIRSNFSGQKILIKDVGKVVDGSQKEQGRQYLYQPNKGNDYKLSPSTSIQIFKSTSADTLNLVAQIEKSLNNFEANLDSSVYQIYTYFNEADQIKRRLWVVISNVLTGLFLVFFIFLLFLPSRIGFMAAMSLPLSVLAAFALLPSLGVTFNIVSMSAFVICIGMLVDNSVVISEYYSRLLSKNNISQQEAALLSVKKFAKPITATVLTTIVAFLPMLVTTGVMGQFIKWIPLIVTISLAMSLFESFFLLPARLQWVSNKKPKIKYQGFILSTLDTMENKFEIIITKIVAKKYTSLSVICFLLVSGFLVNKFGNKVDLFEKRSPQFYTAFLKMPPNSLLDYSDKKAKDISKEMHDIIGAKNIKSISVQSKEDNSQIIAYVTPSAMQNLDYKSVLNKLQKIEKQDLKKLRFNIIAGGPPAGKPFQVAIQSNSREKITKFIDAIYPEIEKIPGIMNLEIDPDSDVGTEYQIQLKKDILSQLSLDVSSVGSALRTALEGSLITELTKNGESFYIRVKYDDKKISSVKDLKQIYIKERGFERLIPLSQIANIIETQSEPNRKKYNFQPSILIQSELNPAITTSIEINRRAKKIIDKKIKGQSSVSYKIIGQQENTQESLKSLSKAMLISIFAIFTILIAVLRSFLFSFLVISCIPLGLIGVSWAFFLHQRPLSFFAMIGIIGLSGVVVNSAIILVSYILNMKENSSKSLSEIVIQASKLRFRPILITNLTTLGGLLPTAYGIAGYEPRLMPMTLALFWGLLVATLLTLVWVPCGVLAIDDMTQVIKKILRKPLLNKYFSSKNLH